MSETIEVMASASGVAAVLRALADAKDDEASETRRALGRVMSREHAFAEPWLRSLALELPRPSPARGPVALAWSCRTPAPRPKEPCSARSRLGPQLRDEVGFRYPILIQECFVQIDSTMGLAKLALAVAFSWKAVPWELQVNLRALPLTPAAGVFWTNAIPVPEVE